jgi:hypothetical protein
VLTWKCSVSPGSALVSDAYPSITRPTAERGTAPSAVPGKLFSTSIGFR